MALIDITGRVWRLLLSMLSRILRLCSLRKPSESFDGYESIIQIKGSLLSWLFYHFTIGLFHTQKNTVLWNSRISLKIYQRTQICVHPNVYTCVSIHER